MGELKPCPCCGSTAEAFDDPEGGIECIQCDLKMPSHALITGSPLERWNRRHNERTPAEEAALRAAVAMRATSMGSDAIEDRIDDVCTAVEALLQENPAWGEEGKG